jgi:predicted MFS family arabinose efflux permease
MAVRQIILASGLWNIVMSFGVFAVAQMLPDAARERIGVPEISSFWTLMVCGVLCVTGSVLVLAARDLTSRGSIVYYEGLARLVAAVLLLTLGRAELGTLAVLIGFADLLFGLAQVFVLPVSLGRTHKQILMDKPVAIDA